MFDKLWWRTNFRSKLDARVWNWTRTVEPGAAKDHYSGWTWRDSILGSWKSSTASKWPISCMQIAHPPIWMDSYGFTRLGFSLDLFCFWLLPSSMNIWVGWLISSPSVFQNIALLCQCIIPKWSCEIVEGDAILIKPDYCHSSLILHDLSFPVCTVRLLTMSVMLNMTSFQKYLECDSKRFVIFFAYFVCFSYCKEMLIPNLH